MLLNIPVLVHSSHTLTRLYWLLQIVVKHTRAGTFFTYSYQTILVTPDGFLTYHCWYIPHRHLLDYTGYNRLLLNIPVLVHSSLILLDYTGYYRWLLNIPCWYIPHKLLIDYTGYTRCLLNIPVLVHSSHTLTRLYLLHQMVVKHTHTSVLVHSSHTLTRLYL